MTSKTSRSSSVEEDYPWSSQATAGTGRSLPPSESSPRIEITEAENNPTTPPTTAASAAASPIIPNPIIENIDAQAQNSFSMENFEADDDNIYTDFQTALADDFMQACNERIASLLQDFDVVLDQT